MNVETLIDILQHVSNKKAPVKLELHHYYVNGDKGPCSAVVYDSDEVVLSDESKS